MPLAGDTTHCEDWGTLVAWHVVAGPIVAALETPRGYWADIGAPALNLPGECSPYPRPRTHVCPPWAREGRWYRQINVGLAGWLDEQGRRPRLVSTETEDA